MSKKNMESTRELMGTKEVTNYSVRTYRNDELVYFLIQPSNISVLSQESLSARIYGLMTVLKGITEIEMMCLNSRENFEDNKRYLKKRMEEETNPAVRKLLEKDANYLDRMQVQMATAREFLLIIRIRNQKENEIFSYLNRIEKMLVEQGFKSKRAEEEDIRRILAVYFAFHGGFVPLSMPADYKEYIYKMQQSFEWIDAAMDEIDAVAEGDVQDRYLVRAVFYSLYFGEDWLWLGESDYQRFAESFVKFEDRTRIVTDEEGGQSVENYQASIAITDKVELFERIKDHYWVEVTYEQQANAMNVWHIAKYNTTAMQESDAYDDGWTNWNGGGDVTYYDLPASEVGGKVVELAMSRLGHPYSQTYRGKDNYVDCSYLTLWCYRQVGIILPGTAAEQGRYLVEHNLTIAKEDLQPGDLVFWSYKPNGRFMNITHVGIYAGDGKVVDASYSKGKVVYRNLFDEDKQVLYGRPQ